MENVYTKCFKTVTFGENVDQLYDQPVKLKALSLFIEGREI